VSITPVLDKDYRRKRAMNGSSPQQRAEKLAENLAAMNRRRLIQTLRSLECSFELDFTDEFLRSISIERLRHITLAAALREVRCKNQRPDNRKS